MPARKKKEEQINLLPQRGFQATTTGRLLSWILSTFRVIVIVTEIIVMIAFLSRFYFDAQNSDLNEEIGHKQAVLTAARDFEIKFKDVQKRLSIFANLTTQDSPYSDLLNLVKSRLPGDVVLVSVTGEKDNLKITGITPNGKGIQQFVVNLSYDKQFSEVSLQTAGTKLDDTSLYEFTVNLVDEKPKTETEEGNS